MFVQNQSSRPNFSQFHIRLSLISSILVINNIDRYTHLIEFLSEISTQLQVFYISHVCLKLFMNSILQKCCKLFIKQYLINFIFPLPTVIFIVFTEFYKCSLSYWVLCEIVCFWFIFLILFFYDINIIKWYFLTWAVFQSAQLLKTAEKYILTHKRRSFINHVHCVYAFLG